MKLQFLTADGKPRLTQIGCESRHSMLIRAIVGKEKVPSFPLSALIEGKKF